MKQEKIHKFMAVATELAKLSSCQSRKVGCILLDMDGIILSTGYNGPPRNMGECSRCNRKSGENLDVCPAVHAEMNALIQCADIRHAYYCIVTTKPCRHCIKMLLNTPIQELIYLDDYPHEGVTELWQKAGKFIQQMDCI